MPLRARVGRHARTGAQCQNWIDDQQTVIALLNLISTADGGAQAGISGRVVAGISSDALFKAILRFQQRHFAADQSGFVEPDGPVLAQMEQLALRPAAEPAPDGEWGEFKSGSVQRALRAALADDHFLSQVKVVEILRATLANGIVSHSELDDLQMVADKSRSIMPRSKAMLEKFVKSARDAMKDVGPFVAASTPKIYAFNLVCGFLRRLGRGRWPMLDRDEVGVGLLMRIAYPSMVRQGDANLCGPAAMLYNFALDRPAQYAAFAIDMYEKGSARLGNLSIEPGAGMPNLPFSIFNYAPPAGAVDPVDWLTMASIRDSENWFMSFDSVDGTLSGATTPMELARWFYRAGYSDVREEANLIFHRRTAEQVDDASRLFSAGYRVCLLIDDQMLYVDKQAKSGSAFLTDRHWIVLRSTIDRSGGNVKFAVFTWGEGYRHVPESGVLPLGNLLENYYGYVAARP